MTLHGVQPTKEPPCTTEPAADGLARQQAAFEAQRQLAAQRDAAVLSDAGKQMQALLLDTLAAAAAYQEAYDLELATTARDGPHQMCVFASSFFSTMLCTLCPIRVVPPNAGVLWSAALGSVAGMRGVFDAPLQADELREMLGKDVVTALFTTKCSARLKKYDCGGFPPNAVAKEALVPLCCHD